MNSKITSTDTWISDSSAFVFSLKSNGRINGMKKFNISSSSYGFELYNKSNSRLFQIGSDIYINKPGCSSSSYTAQNYFNYEGISNALVGQQYFMPKHFMVIQMK